MTLRKKVFDTIKNAYTQLVQKDECIYNKNNSCDTTLSGATKTNYSKNEILSNPPEADMGLSCGNPVAIASLKPDDAVLDIGSGAGFDCFLAAQIVTKGKVIGIDFSEAMVEKAKSIAERRKIQNAEFRVGSMENLPVESNSIDVVMSNCAINLSPNKKEIFSEIYRVLKPGGRIAVSDVCLKKPLPDDLKPLLKIQACLQANLLITQYQALLEESNFKNINLSFKEIGNCIEESSNDPFGKEIASTFKNKYNVGDYLVSIQITANK